MSNKFIPIIKNYNYTNTLITRTRSNNRSLLNSYRSSLILNKRLFHDSPNTQSTVTRQHQHQQQQHEIEKVIDQSTLKINQDPYQLETQSLNTTISPISSIPTIPNPNEYLKAFNNKELLSFFMIGLCTLNKPILQLCIKLFPYVPMFIIKSLVYRIYCGGETIEEVKNTGLRLQQRGINNMMISLTIEACEGNERIDPQYIIDETNKSIEGILVPHTVKMIETSGLGINDIPSGYVALKPTGFIEDAANVLKNYNNGEESRFEDLVSKITKVCSTIYDSNIKLSKKYPERVAPFVVAVIDAEKYDLQEGVYELQRRLYKKFNKIGKPISVVGTLQMYLSNSSNLLEYEEKLASKNGYRLGLKLVRGAYLHSEKNRDLVIHKTKQDTDNNYNMGITYCINQILNQHKPESSTIGHLVVASHNSDSLKLSSSKTYNQQNSKNPNKNNIVLGQLLGMADSITYDLIEKNKIGNVIKYVAWGPPLETKEYLLRRLEENGDAVKNDNGWPLVKASFFTLINRLGFSGKKN
ncbi:PUT1 [Candida jiufengensis]|uniref:PUT1 n=1 Tax=Candida jiufengensis TaxID=497108 RepID=UPI00222472B1|nr:PUT1 [Candida jiufengensis]KAI5956244.1 PUT1 [Candida jiufengensis]